MAVCLQQSHSCLHTRIPPSIYPKTPSLAPFFSPPKTEANNEYLRKQGNLKEAFSSLLNPSQEPYSSSSVQVKQIHACILKTTSDGFLYTRLLFVYGRCGYLHAAHQLFDEFPQRNIYAWNALIGAYAASNERPEKALEIYWDMRRLGQMPDGCTFASLLKACAFIKDLASGILIHNLAVKCGLICLNLVTNALLSMYAKCGRFDLARKLFEWMPDKSDVVLWNSVISGCLQIAKYADAIHLFREMQRIGVRMDCFTAISVIQACTELSLLKLGREVHAFLLKTPKKDPKLHDRNALIVMYTRSGCMADAARLFFQMDEKDCVTWNSLLSGYAQNSLYWKTVDLFYLMLTTGYYPDQVSLINAASALGRLRRLLNGKEIHGYAIKQDLDSNLQMGNTLMDMYAKCCLVSYTKLIFQQIINKDVISWTVMITCYAQNSYFSEAIEFFRQIQKEGIEIDSMIIGSILQACCGLACLSLLKQIHAYTIRGMLLDLVIKNTIIDVYGECGEVGCALNVFNIIENKVDVVSWTSMITCYVRNMLFNDALSLFVEMMKANVEPDVVALLSILSAAAGLASLMKGKEVHAFMMRRCPGKCESVSSSLVDMYARCGSIDESLRIFNGAECKDLVLWTSIIDACGMHGRGRDAISLFAEMEALGLVPDHITFLVLLRACSHSKLVMDGKIFFDKMINEHKLEPWPEHYACIVDLFGRAGKLNEACDFIREMPTKPTAPVWCALFGACRVYSNYELGKFAAKKLIEFKPENPGNHVLISNFFAAMGNWEDVEELRLQMKKRGMKKQPSCSWFEVGSKIHAFSMREEQHEDSSTIYAVLGEITQSLARQAGFVADDSLVLHDVGDEERTVFAYGSSHCIHYG